MAGKHVPAVEKGPETREGITVCLWDIVVDGANIYGKDDGSAEGFHVGDR